MRSRIAAHSLGVQIAEMRQVHQIVDHQHVIAFDRVDVVLVRPLRLVVVEREIDDRCRIGLRCFAHPHPDELILLDHRIAAHPSVLGNARLPRNGDAASRPVEDQTVVAALDAGLDDASHMQRRRAMAAPVGQRRGAVCLVAKQHERFVADAAGERFCAELIGPGGDVPDVAEQHRRAPRVGGANWRR
jgi:hypothetical protein